MELPPRPDLPQPVAPPAQMWEPIPSRRSPRLLAALVAMVVALTAMAGGISALVSLVDEPPSSTPDQHEFILLMGDGSPARWNPCQPIHYVVNLGPAPPDSIEDVHEAVRRVSAATGVAFVYDGTTDERLERNRDTYQPSRYGQRWAPVLIAWVDPETVDVPFESEGETAAAVARPLTGPGSRGVFVSGWIAMNARDPNPPGFSYPGAQGPTMQHEWGHIMGLGHVEQEGELMDPEGGGMTDFGPGDLEGLRSLGVDSGCLDAPEPRT